MVRGPVLVLTLFLFGPWASAQDQEPAPPAEALAAAREALDQGDLPAAEERFRAAAEAGVLEGWLGLAEVLEREGEPEAAADALWSYFGARPEDTDVGRRLAALLADLPGHEWEALPLHEDLLDRLPGDAALRLDHARLLSRTGRHHEARAELARLADDAEPELARAARLALADDYNRSGLRHRADALYRELLAERADPAILRGLADLELRQGRPAAAAALFQEALAADPDDYAARESLAAAEAAQAPQWIARAESYRASDDWRRLRLLTGVGFAVAGDTRLRLAWARDRYRDRTGASLVRNSLVLRGDWRPDPFVTVQAGLEAGDQGRGSNPRGGVGVRYEPAEAAFFAFSYRHDDFLDPAGPFVFDRRNDSLDLSRLGRLGLQSDTLAAEASYLPSDALGFRGHVAGGTIEDGNNRSDLALELLHGFSFEPGLELRPHLGYARRHYQLASPAYFTPSNLESWSAGCELAAWSWNRGREFRCDLAVFRQPSGIDAWGFRADADYRQRLGDATSLQLGLSWLTTPERGPGSRLRSLALLAGLALAF